MIKKLFSEKKKFSIALILLFHTIGLIGFCNEPLTEIFKSLVPLHLLLMFGILLWNNHSWNKHFGFLIVIIYVLSFTIEMIGTNTGLIFGEYTYGQTLGWKLWNTPLMIGINWFLLVYGAGISLSYVRIKNSWLFAFLGACILVLLDVLIEPVAVRFDYWQWQSISIPIQNYIAWFIVSYFFMLIFSRLHFNKQNIIGPILLLVQFLFFILLNVL
jgi:bisanhydrobacterioruberin hydratase